MQITTDINFFIHIFGDNVTITFFVILPFFRQKIFAIFLKYKVMTSFCAWMAVF
jgi:hypothetical protein